MLCRMVRATATLHSTCLTKENEMEFNYKQLEQMFNLDPVIDQAEKTAAQVFSYVPHAELKETLLTLNKANANFARANVVAGKNLGAIVHTMVDSAQKTIKATANK